MDRKVVAVPGIIFQFLGLLWAVWMEMFAAFIEYVPKLIKLFLWFLAGLFILPCVFIAGNLFEPWTKWGEKM